MTVSFTMLPYKQGVNFLEAIIDVSISESVKNVHENTDVSVI